MVETNNKWTPITRFAKVDQFFKTMDNIYHDLQEGHKTRAKIRTFFALRHVKASFIKDVLWPVMKTGSYKALSKFMRKVVMIGRCWPCFLSAVLLATWAGTEFLAR